jgi:hypothetical protein
MDRNISEKESAKLLAQASGTNYQHGLIVQEYREYLERELKRKRTSHDRKLQIYQELEFIDRNLTGPASKPL